MRKQTMDSQSCFNACHQIRGGLRRDCTIRQPGARVLNAEDIRPKQNVYLSVYPDRGVFSPSVPSALVQEFGRTDPR